MMMKMKKGRALKMMVRRDRDGLKEGGNWRENVVYT